MHTPWLGRVFAYTLGCLQTHGFLKRPLTDTQAAVEHRAYNLETQNDQIDFWWCIPNIYYFLL